jgi:hypothetical protein
MPSLRPLFWCHPAAINSHIGFSDLRWYVKSGWRSGWDIMLRFWLMPPNKVLDLGFLSSYTFRKSVKSCIVKDGQFSFLS